MIRRIIQIDEEKCNGCGLCAKACHEGAIGMVNGKAKLLREDYCDGLGDCLPACPRSAIQFEMREAPAYNEEAVRKSKEDTKLEISILFKPETMLANWPVQIKLAPIQAPYFDGADLLIAADCTAYAYANFHRDFIKDRITLIGCPKLDSVDYSQKLTAIITSNNIRSITVVRMEVPCCGGIEYAVQQAILRSGKELPLQVITVSTNGKFCKNQKGLLQKANL